VDADDILVGGDKIKPFIKDHDDFNGISMNYQFAFIDDEMTRPKCVTTGQRISRTGYWEGKMHEKFYGRMPCVFFADAYMKHDHKFRRKEKLQRNLDDCIEEYAETPDFVRTYNLAQANHDLNNISEALKYYNKYLKFDIDLFWRYRIMLCCSDLYAEQGELHKALNVARKASKLYPHEALWVFKCAYIYVLQGKYDRAINMYRQGFTMMQAINTVLWYNPEDYGYNPATNFYNCLYITGQKLLAYMTIGELLLKYPNDKPLLKMRETLWEKHKSEFAADAAKL
jgi:tetratricopeptide (TPR) repeat protein